LTTADARTDLDFVHLPERPADYREVWELQRSVHAAVAAGERPDTVLLVEHADVYTAGKRTGSADRPVDGTEVVDVDRGGRITWHGPGQLVAYPIVRLREPIDVVGYVRALETAVMATCTTFEVPTIRVEGRSGVWCAVDVAQGAPERKIAAIGVRVARGVTMHGVALNCDADLTAFDRIVPCGITDAGVTSLSAETGRHVPIPEVEPVLVRELAQALASVRMPHASDPLLRGPSALT
jgi:lipoyl(octanoyl) transferase